MFSTTKSRLGARDLTAAPRSGRRSRSLRRVTAGLAITGLSASAFVATAGSAEAAASTRVDLKVLVVSLGGPEDAIANALTTEGVPFTKIDLKSASRPTINEAFLADTVSTGPRAKYQAVVLPNAAPTGLSADEKSALADYERTYKIREVLAYAYSEPGVGLNTPEAPGYSGTLDGKSATVTAAARAEAFGYLSGSLKFEDSDPKVSETYGYVSTPLATDPATNASFTPYVTTALANGSSGGVLAGVHAHDGREDLVLTFSTQANQGQFRALQHGIISWMTRGVHLGYNRNYFTVHVDDVFSPNARWSTTANCTPTSDCASPDVTTPTIRMTPDDVDALIAWQNKNNFKLDQLYNGAGSDEYVQDHGSDPLLERYLGVSTQLRWLNHTYKHLNLGCLKTDTLPWACTKTADGAIAWQPYDTIYSEINDNITWAAKKNIKIDRTELVSGEHSGLLSLPQQSVDNPDFIRALGAVGIKNTGSDASREANQRMVGNTTTIPRYPMSMYYNVGTRAEMMDEYNWLYTSRADGGSGNCEDNPQTVTCIKPKTAGEFDSYLLPLETTIDMRHIVGNDPRPHYVHQSNLAEDRLLYPMLDDILKTYKNLFVSNTPIVNQTQTEASAALTASTTWKSAQSGVTAYTLDGRVYIEAGSSVSVPITVPTGTELLATDGKRSTFGDAYQGERSAFRSGASTLVLPAA